MVNVKRDKNDHMQYQIINQRVRELIVKLRAIKRKETQVSSVSITPAWNAYHLDHQLVCIVEFNCALRWRACYPSK